MQISPEAPVAQSLRAEVGAGWRTALPACVAVLPLGLALGVLVVRSGLDWWWAPILAAVVFAGSLEFLLVGMLAAAAPLGQIAATALVVNFRHSFYALSFPLHRVNGLGLKAYSTFARTDEAYALTSTPDATQWSRTRIVCLRDGRLPGVVLHDARWYQGVASRFGQEVANEINAEALQYVAENVGRKVAKRTRDASPGMRERYEACAEAMFPSELRDGDVTVSGDDLPTLTMRRNFAVTMVRMAGSLPGHECPCTAIHAGWSAGLRGDLTQNHAVGCLRHGDPACRGLTGGRAPRSGAGGQHPTRRAQHPPADRTNPARPATPTPTA